MLDNQNYHLRAMVNLQRMLEKEMLMRKINVYMTRYSLSNREFAKECCLSEKTIRNILDPDTDVFNPTIETVLKIVLTTTKEEL